MEKLVNALLNDDHGISEEAYNALVERLEEMAMGRNFRKDHAPNALKIVQVEGKVARKLLAKVKQADATDGRFYFPRREG